MAFQILLTNEDIDPTEIDFLLRFPVQANQVSLVDFITNSGWGALKHLTAMEDFRNLDRDLENNANIGRNSLKMKHEKKKNVNKIERRRTLFRGSV